jgi:DNA polymerase III alpha subunit
MRLDNYSNPVFNEQDLFDALYKGQILSPAMFVDLNKEIQSLEQISEIKFTEPYPEDLEVTKAEYDAICQQNWNMPNEYKQMDIEQWILEQCNNQRVQDELAEYKARNMLDLLRWLKYFVDTCRADNIVWGVGRGSSVASYVLYLIGVHKIDSIKYNLDWQEFLR